MVLTVGGPPVRGGWYFTSSVATTRHTYGSLNYWKGNADAVFPGVGEVQKYGWRNGSALPCLRGGQCFSLQDPGYSTARLFDYLQPGGVAMIHSGGDTWSFVHGLPGPLFGDFVLTFTCSTVSHLEMLELTYVPVSGLPSSHFYASASATDTTGKHYIYHTLAGDVPRWLGGDVTAVIAP